MRPVKRSLMDLNLEEEEDGRFRRAVVDIGDHISSSLAQWSLSDDRLQWKRLGPATSLLRYHLLVHSLHSLTHPLH